MAYLTVQEFATRSILSSTDVDYLETRYPGFLDSRLAVNTSRIHARLGKRYDWPFASPVAEIVLGWLVALTTIDAFEKRGWDPSDVQSANVVQARDNALDEIKEAADAKDGLFELPLRQDNPTTAITRGAPLVYTQTSPYAAMTSQRRIGRSEDRDR